MEVKIGITDVPREVTIDVTASPDELIAQLREAFERSTLLELTDEKGRRLIIPSQRIAYLDLGSPSSGRVGFGAL